MAVSVAVPVGKSTADRLMEKLIPRVEVGSLIMRKMVGNGTKSAPLGKALATNTGLMTLNLLGMRVNSEVCAAFAESLQQNMTLCKLIWKLEVSGFTLRFTELTNRNTEIDRCIRENKDYLALLPKEMQANPPFDAATILKPIIFKHSQCRIHVR